MKFNIFLFCLVQFCLISNSLFSQNVEIQGDTAHLDAVVTVNRAYSLPNADGLNGQVITADGNGQSNWSELPASYPSEEGTYVYIVPYVCGFKGAGTLPLGPLASRTEGQYLTSIMLNNPSLDTASIDRQVVLLDAGEFSGPLSGVVQSPYDTLLVDTLPRFNSLELTCTEIDGMMGGGLATIIPPIDGYIILESDQNIKVSTIYTYFGISTEIEPINQGGGLGVGQGQSIDIEQITPVFVPAVPDE